MGNFSNDLNIGKVGENEIKQFLTNHISTIQLIDVSDDKWFQSFDVDFLQVTKDGINKIEVKTDMLAHKTHNMVYEFISNKYTNSIGCFNKTQADYLFYYIKYSKELYIFDIYELRNWVDNNKQHLKVVDMGDCAVGYLIKLNDIRNICNKYTLK